MSNIANIYRAEILRAVFGSAASETKVADMARLSQIAERLADSEAAQAALQAKGYGRDANSFVELVREVPNNVRQMLKGLFASHQPVNFGAWLHAHNEQAHRAYMERTKHLPPYAAEQIAKFYGVRPHGGID